MTQRALITGGAGFIGSHLCDALLGVGWEVVAYDNLSMGSRANVNHHLERPGFTFRQADVRDARALSEAAAGASVIVHLAAYKIPRYGAATDTLLMNTQGTKNVLDTAREVGARVVLASTSDVYGKNPRLPFSEESDLVFGPSSVRRWAYAVSKLFDEHLVFAYQDSYGVEAVILRFFGAYGPRQHLSWWGGPQAVFISAALRGEELEIHGDGLQTRTFIYGPDLVAGIVAAMQTPAAVGEILNLGGTEETAILDLARLIYELCNGGGSPPLRFVSYQSFSKGYEDVRRRVPDLTKARRVLGFSPRVSLRDGLRRTIAWQRVALAGDPSWLPGDAGPGA